jgi:ATP-binding cassette subfamily B (MDR/TAP) protein 1
LDEATSALDTESERLVQTAIDKLLESSNRTTIVIAHRLSTVRHADVIAVLENGQIVEMGSHDELIQKKGKYDLLIQAQKHPEKTSESGLNSKPPSAWSSRTSSSVPFDESDDRGSEDEQETPVLRFRDVKFAYPTRPDSTILSDFNLSVHSGETLAIVGPSGHGKSTVIQLIERFYDPGEGCIELDGVDLRSCNPNWLRDQVGL